jgi:phosphoglycerate dehydrogenase-like enzyme
LESLASAISAANCARLSRRSNAVPVYDLWLPDDLIRSYDCSPIGLDDLLHGWRVVFMFASVTTENQGFIGKREFELMRPGTAFLLKSRAAVVDFPEFIR